jgi:HSP20 family protein
MGIMDKVAALVPGRGRHHEPSPAAFDALALRDDLDRWVQQFFEESGALAIADFPSGQLPEVIENDDEVVVKMEVPGLDRDDLELSITDSELTISGQRRDDRRSEREGALATERSYRYLLQTVTLPPDIDPDRAAARVDRGVLTVRFPRTAASSTARRIHVKTKT